MSPLVLDVDGSVGRLPGELRIALRNAQEALRFGCTVRTLRRLWPRLPRAHGTVFFGSGDFHHFSWPLIERAALRHPGLTVLVLDNHPDNMRYPFGVHCGSWVSRVAALPGVRRVEVAGITSGDIGLGHAWENRWRPLLNGKLRYWSTGVDTSWARRVGLGASFRSFADADTLVDALACALHAERTPCYVSIDKDVFAPQVVHTNWDQGRFAAAHAVSLIAAVHGRIIGSDVTGDVSSYVYRSRFKRWLSQADGQDTQIDATTLAAWQTGQHALNLQLLKRLAGAAAR